MATEIVMPQMGAEMEEGTVVSWLVKPGDHIKRGDKIGEIETDKATVDFEVFDEGYFLGPVVELGQTVPVGTVVAYLGAQGEALPAGTAPAAGGAPGGATPAAAAAPSTGEQSAVQAAPATQEQSAPPAQERPAAQAATPAQEQPAASATPSQTADGAARPGGQPAGHVTGAQPTPAQVPAQRVGTANGHQQAGAPAPAEAGGRLRASPVARGIAEDLGIDLRQVHGSGPDGRIMRHDVEEFARARAAAPIAPPTPPAPPAPPAVEAAPTAREAPAPPPAAPPAPPPPPTREAPTPVPAGAIEPLSRMRQAIARRMAAAKREIPHYYLTANVDMVEAMALRRQVNATLGESGKVSVNDLIVKACALAIERHPRFNATFTDEGLRLNPAINIGIAVALEDGLIVPAVLGCQGKSLGAIAREAHDVTERARAGHLRPAELSDGTFTVSNLGMYGVETLIAIIQPGQAAILGVGAVEPRPVVRDGQIVARETMTIALSADHRVTDGAQGARFLAEIKALLEQPLSLVL